MVDEHLMNQSKQTESKRYSGLNIVLFLAELIFTVAGGYVLKMPCKLSAMLL